MTLDKPQAASRTCQNYALLGGDGGRQAEQGWSQHTFDACRRNVSEALANSVWERSKDTQPIIRLLPSLPSR
jgi:hypothetical protein